VEYKGWSCSAAHSLELGPLLFVAAVGFVLPSDRCRLHVPLSFGTAHRLSGHLNATICVTQAPDGFNGAVPL